MVKEDKNKKEELTLVFGTEGLLESAKEPFIGEVIFAEYPCHCEDCEKGALGLAKMLAEEGRAGEMHSGSLHIKIKPLTVYTKEQSEWWIPTKTKLSKWGALQKQLETLGLIDRFKTEREKAFMSMTAEWQWTLVEEVGVSTAKRPAVFHWIPVRILTEDEIATARASKPEDASEEKTSLD